MPPAPRPTHRPQPSPDAILRAVRGDKPAPQLLDLARLRWLVLSDGKPGHENQSLGLVQALGVPDPEVITLQPVWPSGWLSKLARLLPVRQQWAVWPDADAYDVIVGTGWQVSRAVRALKRQKPCLFTVQIMRPGGRPADYDVVVLPQHDSFGWRARTWRNAGNVVRTLAAPNRITKELLHNEGQRWAQRLRQVPAPRLALLVGGTSRHGTFSPADAQRLAKEIGPIAKSNGLSLLVSASRRTGAAAARALREAFAAQGLPIFFWAPPGLLPDEDFGRDNPYLAFLHHAECLVVTSDSVSMISEAATAGKPVYVWPMPGKLPKKFRLLLDDLAGQGRLRWWDGKLTLRTSAAGLMDTLLAAGFVRSRLSKAKSGL